MKTVAMCYVMYEDPYFFKTRDMILAGKHVKVTYEEKQTGLNIQQIVPAMLRFSSNVDLAIHNTVIYPSSGRGGQTYVVTKVEEYKEEN